MNEFRQVVLPNQRDHFAADVDSVKARVMYAVQQPWPRLPACQPG